MSCTRWQLPELGPVYSSVQCSAGGSVKWIDRIPGRVVSVVGNATFCAIGVATGDLYIVSPSGRRLFPCISTSIALVCVLCWSSRSQLHLVASSCTDACSLVNRFAALGGPLSLLECSPKESPYLLVILATGAMKVWDVTKRALTLTESIKAITNVVDATDARRLTLLRCHITVKGQPILTFAQSSADGKGASSLLSYTFDQSMGCWCVSASSLFDGAALTRSSLTTGCLSVCVGCASPTTALCSRTSARRCRRTQSCRQTSRYGAAVLLCASDAVVP